MNTYSQNKEDLIIAEYFGDFKGNLLSIGENDGRTFSNALAFIELGWKAHLVEPSWTFHKMVELHSENDNVKCHDFAIGDSFGFMTFYESGPHVKNGKDSALVSTLDIEETKRWPNVEFKPIEVAVLEWKRAHWRMDYEQFDYISIDCEGNDLKILKQIDLSHTKVLIIEWNSIIDLKKAYQEYCLPFGLRIIHENAENLIFAR